MTEPLAPGRRARRNPRKLATADVYLKLQFLRSQLAELEFIPLSETRFEPPAFESPALGAIAQIKPIDIRTKDFIINKSLAIWETMEGEVAAAEARILIGRPDLMSRFDPRQLESALMSEDEAKAQAAYVQVTLRKIYARIERGGFRPQPKTLGYSSQEELKERVEYLFQKPLKSYSPEEAKELNRLMKYFIPQLVAAPMSSKIEFDVRYLTPEYQHWRNRPKDYKEKQKRYKREYMRQYMRKYREKRRKQLH